MKLFRSVFLLSAITLLGSACISRTVMIEHEQRGEIPLKGKGYGSETHGELVEKKIIWFWQEDFRRPE